LQPIKVESRKPGSRQETLQSDDWRVLGYAPGAVAPRGQRGQRGRSNRGKCQRWQNLRLAGLSVIALVLTGSLIVSQSSSTSSTISASLWDRIDGLAARAGLGVHQISLSGHRYSSDIDLFGVLSAHSGRSMIGLDVKGATDDLTKLAWVKNADIKRKYPDELVVRIEERRPYAVWQLGEQFWLVDKTGLKLAPIMKPRVGDLPRISGIGANKNFSDLMGRLNGLDGIGSDGIGSEISSFKFIGNRRWTLTFLNGVVVELPGDREGRALSVLKELMGNRRVWTSDIKSVDLRLGDRISIIRTPVLEAGRVASGRIKAPRIVAKSIEAKSIEAGHIETGTLSAADLALPTPDASLSSAPRVMINRRGG